MISQDKAPSRLGRGLAALIGDADATELQAEPRPRGQKRVPIEHLTANPRNPRKVFDADELADLVASVKTRGVIQPILVRPAPGQSGHYEIIAGERRWRASQAAGLHEVPVVVIEADDRLALEIAIIENVQRTNLNPVEEAEGFQRLVDEFGYTQTELAQSIGKSRSHLANTLRLLKLPTSIRAHLAEGRLSAGHARTLINVEDPERLADEILKNDLSVREAEKLARDPAKPVRAKSATAQGKDADTRALERQLAELLGLSVDLRHDQSGSGELRIRYRSLEQLDDVARRLGYRS
ncbi:ParB/RepB/Spo0J family partition protein [Lutibaculum baratangense]|uniref:Chromosome (Plasmid) partitioning protein ParB n=1 Tax=Lutibaculum baratangense AMV1 TaxID=631454 RepID=V4TJI6_9HYPH|nr:ParB/RepB/Spo0J family partition protein [Lutibaculum baratangense]ESR26068.1 Chromosome (plasmid) partitioning protein ParB [Lutibaculum baratangense AMV1]